MKLVKNKLRVIHIPQVPMEGFKVEVRNEREAFLLQNTFANQHLWLLEKNVIPDYCNVILVEMWDEDLDLDENGEKWTDYWNEEEMMEWDDFVQEYNDYLSTGCQHYKNQVIKQTSGFDDYINFSYGDIVTFPDEDMAERFKNRKFKFTELSGEDYQFDDLSDPRKGEYIRAYYIERFIKIKEEEETNIKTTWEFSCEEETDDTNKK